MLARLSLTVILLVVFIYWQLPNLIAKGSLYLMVGGHTIRCILFDLGSTLWTRREDTAPLAEKAAHQRAGGILRSALSSEAFASPGDAELGELLYQAIEKQMHADHLQHPGYEPDGGLATPRALQEFGIGNADREVADAIFEALRVRIPDSRILFPDALSTLAALKECGYLLGVVTNRSYGGPLFREDVAEMGLLDFFEYRHMAISADLGVCKPNPDIFKYALASLNIAPEETAMVGDNLRADIVGAKRLHLLSIWKREPTSVLLAEERHAPDAIEPDVEIERLGELLEIF
jgi:HAD superfamily hydrolase (TIGR01549 family)